MIIQTDVMRRSLYVPYSILVIEESIRIKTIRIFIIPVNSRVLCTDINRICIIISTQLTIYFDFFTSLF